MTQSRVPCFLSASKDGFFITFTINSRHSRTSMIPISAWVSVLLAFAHRQGPIVRLSSWSLDAVSTDSGLSDNNKVNSKFPVRAVIENTQQIYKDLSSENNGICRSYSPTIKFSFVQPPDGGDLQLEQDPESLYQTIASSHGHTKPLLLYLPGLDGVGISAIAQFKDLSHTFELWRMYIDPREDRSTFTQLTTAVYQFILDAAVKLNRPVILVGESFGGLLAPSVALRVQSVLKQTHPSVIQGLILINPATSFDQTLWSTLGPLLTTLRHLEDDDSTTRNGGLTPYSLLGGMALSAVVPDAMQMRRIFSLLTGVSITSVDDVNELLSIMRDGFGILADQLPAKVVEHRVSQWLPVGSMVVNPLLSSIQVKTLVIAGENDNMLPTKREAIRLSRTMPKCKNVLVKGAGHFVLDERVNLTQTIIDSYINPFNTTRKIYDPITHWEVPSMEEINETIERQVRPLRILTSPVFISTGLDGKRRFGLGQIPTKGHNPILFVANHQFAGIDLGMIIAELIQKRGILARGLAHPVIFSGFNQQDSDFADTIPSSDLGTFQKFGAVMVSPRNYYRLMETNQTALLFPGGVREVFHGKDEAYKLFWPEKVDFVRTAAKFNATVIPISAIGGADSANIFVDGPDVLKLPFGLGERAINNTRQVRAARYDDNNDELFQPPIALPKPLPARHYFLFGRPMSSAGIDYRNKQACDSFYNDVKKELERGIDDLLTARTYDPYGDTLSRLSYESVLGKTAPTFPIDKLPYDLK